MFDLIFGSFPAVQAGLEGVALPDAHAADFRSDGILLVLGDAIGAAVDVKSRF